MLACPTNSVQTNSTMLCVYSLCVCMCVHAHAQNNSSMDLLLNSEHKAREYDVEKWFVCVCVQAVCLCVEIIF